MNSVNTPPPSFVLVLVNEHESPARSLAGRRYMYTVFMCHLSLEKALKGLYAEKIRKEPPKTHNLLYLIEKMKLKLPEDLHDIISTLNRVSVTTRYPDDLQRILKDYDKKKTKKVLDQSKKVLQWLSAR